MLVRIDPSDVMITPDPSSVPPLAVTSIDTTLGCTAAATLASVSVGLVPPLTTVPLAMVVGAAVVPVQRDLRTGQPGAQRHDQHEGADARDAAEPGARSAGWA